jgi:hypothetical protein
MAVGRQYKNPLLAIFHSYFNSKIVFGHPPSVIGHQINEATFLTKLDWIEIMRCAITRVLRMAAPGHALPEHPGIEYLKHLYTLLRVESPTYFPTR